MATDARGGIKINDEKFYISINGNLTIFNSKTDLTNAMSAIGNRALSFSEEYSLESLWHELLHNQQLKTLALSPSAEHKKC
ncbi:MAG: hypothetical protein WCJ49_01275 [Deltaproteobacteria bacterium]